MTMPPIYTTSLKYSEFDPSAGNAGYDLFPLSTVVIPPRETMAVKTGEHILVGPANVGFVFPRSSASTSEVFVGTGVIDAGYKGDIMMSVTNKGATQFTLTTNMSPAQFVVVPLSQNPIVFVDDAKFNGLPADGRGTGGFGSTGSTV